MISARPYRTASERTYTIVASHEKLFNIRQHNRVAVWITKSANNTICPNRIRSNFKEIPKVSFCADVLRKQSVEDFNRISFFVVSTRDSAENISRKIQVAIEIHS